MASREQERDRPGYGRQDHPFEFDGADDDALPRKRWHRVVAAVIALAFSLVIVSMGFVRHAQGVHGHLAPFFGAPPIAR